MKKCKFEAIQDEDSMIFDDEEEEAQEINSKDEIITASIYRLMEALEEFKEESDWNSFMVTRYVMKHYLKSEKPVSIYELENFVKDSGALTAVECDTFINEIRFLQSISQNLKTKLISMTVRDYISHQAR